MATLIGVTNDGDHQPMRRISSKGTFFIKRVFPAIWFGIAAAIMGLAMSAAVNNNAWIGVLIALLFGSFMIGIGF